MNSDPPSAIVKIEFAADSIGAGLATRTFSCPQPGQCSEYEILVNGAWVAAQLFHMENDFILITSKISAKATVTGARYGFNNFPVSTLVNKDGLPGLPFAFPNPFP